MDFVLLALQIGCYTQRTDSNGIVSKLHKKKVKKRDYKQVYLEYFHLDKTDFIACENCGKPANDIHHLTFRSQGGKDNIENLIAVCRDCHNKAHNSKEFNEKLRKIHLSKL